MTPAQMMKAMKRPAGPPFGSAEPICTYNALQMSVDFSLALNGQF
jgi:hypothetical protein